MTDPQEWMNNAVRDVIAHYEAGVKGALLLEYRCRANGCLLLHVWQTPNGPEFFAPDHRLSDRYTLARHFERLALTEMEGEGGVWAGRLDDYYPYPWARWVPLTCTHVRVSTFMSTIREDLADRPGRPIPILWPRDTPTHD
jgi:hypothetical protein